MPRLEKYLDDEEITQVEFARQLGVSQPTVSEWINGPSLPSADRLIDLSRITRLSIDELLSGRGRKAHVTVEG